MATPRQVIDPLSTEHLHADLKGRSVRGGALTITSQVAQFVVQSISTVILARLLTPSDFGIVAMVTAVTGLGQAFADLGLSEATIQQKELNHNQVSTLFWVNVAIGLALTLATLALAPLLVWFYKEPRIRTITFVISVTFLISGLRVQHDALLKRQMRFMAIAIRDVASWATAVPVAIIMASRGFGYWALIALPLTLNFTQMVISWLMVSWRPGLPRRDANVASMLAFGGNVAASYVVINVNRSVDNVLVGWYWGAGPLGLYSRAYNLLMLPVRQLSAPACSVAVPTFSRIQGDSELFARYYLRTANLIMWIIAPLLGFLFVAAEAVVVVVLGSQWRAAAPVFQILAVSAFGHMLLELTVWLFVSRGQSGRLLKLLLMMSPVFVVSYAVGLPFGFKAVALCGSIAFLAMIPCMLRFSFRGTDLTLHRLGRAIIYPLSTCLGCILIAECALHLVAPQSLFLQIGIVAVAFAAGYLLAVCIRPVQEELATLKQLLRELRPSAAVVPLPATVLPS